MRLKNDFEFDFPGTILDKSGPIWQLRVGRRLKGIVADLDPESGVVTSYAVDDSRRKLVQSLQSRAIDYMLSTKGSSVSEEPRFTLCLDQSVAWEDDNTYYAGTYDVQDTALVLTTNDGEGEASGPQDAAWLALCAPELREWLNEEYDAVSFACEDDDSLSVEICRGNDDICLSFEDTEECISKTLRLTTTRARSFCRSLFAALALQEGLVKLED